MNFDGLVGNTHNYSGLSYGNVASKTNQFQVSNPKVAALQGLEKMKLLKDLGVIQAVLPPHLRPHIPTLRRLGFRGDDLEILKEVKINAPNLLFEVSSAASMWTANSITITDSASSHDKKVHITPANLTSMFHRSIETDTTDLIMKEIFKDKSFFSHHHALLPGNIFSDEGAANHMHLCSQYGSFGLDVFVYGKSNQIRTVSPKNYPARQSLEASQAISRLHLLNSNNVCFVQQNPLAIDSGAFHNDVVALSNQNVLLFHEEAFLNKDAFLNELQEKANKLNKLNLQIIVIKKNEISLEDAISSYFFNSQLVTTSNNEMVLIAPIECKEMKHIKQYIDSLIESPSNPIASSIFVNLKQSMQNGGGPACLRLRAILTREELESINPGVILTDELYVKLKNWIIKYYRDKLEPKDLSDPGLLNESYQSLNELKQLLKLVL